MNEKIKIVEVKPGLFQAVDYRPTVSFFGDETIKNICVVCKDIPEKSIRCPKCGVPHCYDCCGDVCSVYGCKTKLNKIIKKENPKELITTSKEKSKPNTFKRTDNEIKIDCNFPVFIVFCFIGFIVLASIIIGLARFGYEKYQEISKNNEEIRQKSIEEKERQYDKSLEDIKSKLSKKDGLFNLGSISNEDCYKVVYDFLNTYEKTRVDKTNYQHVFRIHNKETNKYLFEIYLNSSSIIFKRGVVDLYILYNNNIDVKELDGIIIRLISEDVAERQGRFPLLP